MATLVREIERPAFLDRPWVTRPAIEREAGAAEAGQRDGEATLDELLVGAWEGLSAHRPVACPVCAGAMAPRQVAPGGACGSCGSQLR